MRGTAAALAAGIGIAVLAHARVCAAAAAADATAGALEEVIVAGLRETGPGSNGDAASA